MMPKQAPSPRQRQIADAVREYGTVTAAAEALGVSRVTVETTLARYHTAVCEVRIDALEAELNALRERDAAGRTASRLEAITGRLERLAVPFSHRRLADGGSRVKEQMRER